MLRDVQSASHAKPRELQMRTIFFLDIPRLFEELGKLLHAALKYTSLWQTLSSLDREREIRDAKPTA
jgi:hypothetical protein